MSRQGRVPGTFSREVDVRAFVWPCGCVTIGSRTGRLERDCGDPACYRRTARPVRRIEARP